MLRLVITSAVLLFSSISVAQDNHLPLTSEYDARLVMQLYNPVILNLIKVTNEQRTAVIELIDNAHTNSKEELLRIADRLKPPANAFEEKLLLNRICIDRQWTKELVTILRKEQLNRLVSIHNAVLFTEDPVGVLLNPVVASKIRLNASQRKDMEGLQAEFRILRKEVAKDMQTRVLAAKDPLESLKVLERNKMQAELDVKKAAYAFGKKALDLLGKDQLDLLLHVIPDLSRCYGAPFPVLLQFQWPEKGLTAFEIEQNTVGSAENKQEFRYQILQYVASGGETDEVTVVYKLSAASLNMSVSGKKIHIDTKSPELMDPISKVLHRAFQSVSTLEFVKRYARDGGTIETAPSNKWIANLSTKSDWMASRLAGQIMHGPQVVFEVPSSSADHGVVDSAKLVKAGETWVTKRLVDSANGPQRVYYTYEGNELVGNQLLQRISFKAEIAELDHDQAAAPKASKNEESGVIWFDGFCGKVIRVESDSKVTLPQSLNLLRMQTKVNLASRGRP